MTPATSGGSVGNVVALARRAWFLELARPLFDHGYAVLPATGKAVFEPNWSSLAIDADRVGAWLANPANGYKNIGIRTGDGLVAIDIDSMDEGVSEAIAQSAVDTFGSDCMVRIGRAPKRLLVFACSDPGYTKHKLEMLSPTGEKHAVEILGKGQQFIAYGVHPDTKLEYRWVSEMEPAETESWELACIEADALDAWFAQLRDLFPDHWTVAGQQTAAPASDDWLGNYRAPLTDIDEDDIRAALAELDPDMDHDEWVKVGMALHHQYRGDPAGLALWEAWSAEGTKYQDGVCETRWASFKTVRDGATTTLASVLKAAREARTTRVIHEQIDATEDWRTRFMACTDRAALEALAQQAARVLRSWPRADQEILVQVYQESFKRLAGGTRLPVAVARETLGVSSSGNRARDIQRAAGDDAPEWLDGWVYVTDRDKFFHLRTKEQVTTKGFDARYNRELGDDLEDLGSFSASRMATDVWQVPVVSGLRYLPFMGELFEIDGQAFANLYRHDSPPDVLARLTPEDEAAVCTVQRHFDIFYPDAAERGHVLDWIAHNVQHPGLKIRWAPLIKGIEGDGKSVLLTLLKAAMGHCNVRPLNANTLENSRFTGWATGHAVVGIEELKLHGHNRYDVVNMLKPYITNDQVSQERKQLDPEAVPNVTNYLCFTNFADAIPIGETDRRYCVLFSPFASTEALTTAVGGDTGAYFTALHEALFQRAGAIRAWLLARDLSHFNRNGNAPETRAKATMRELSWSDEEELARRVIEAGCAGVSKDVISSGHLTKAMAGWDGGGLILESKRVKALIAKLGFQYLDRIKWQGEACRVWVPVGDGSLLTGDRSAVRSLLDATVKQESDRSGFSVTDLSP